MQETEAKSLSAWLGDIQRVESGFDLEHPDFKPTLPSTHHILFSFLLQNAPLLSPAQCFPQNSVIALHASHVLDEVGDVSPGIWVPQILNLVFSIWVP